MPRDSHTDHSEESLRLQSLEKKARTRINRCDTYGGKVTHTAIGITTLIKGGGVGLITEVRSTDPRKLIAKRIEITPVLSVRELAHHCGRW